MCIRDSGVTDEVIAAAVGVELTHLASVSYTHLDVYKRQLYILLMYQRTMTGPKPESAAGTPDISYREKWVVGPLIALFLILGFYPKPVLDMVTPAVTTILTSINVTDPAPAVGAAEGSTK